MAANNARGAAKPTRAAYAASYSRGGGGGALVMVELQRGEKEREEGEETEGVRPHRADGSILLQDRGNSSPFVTWLILLR